MTSRMKTVFVVGRVHSNFFAESRSLHPEDVEGRLRGLRARELFTQSTLPASKEKVPQPRRRVSSHRARRHYFLRCSNSVMCTMKSNGTKKHGINTSGRRCISPVL